MKRIPLTRGKYAIVDDADYEWLNQWKWHSLKGNSTWYVSRSKRKGNKVKNYLMHREILRTPKEKVSDHINGDGLDNRRSNLRICTQAQNSMNKNSSRNTSSKFKGVTFHKQTGKWQSQIETEGKMYYLGYYDDERRAALEYNKKAKEFFGEFAKLNEL